MNKEPAPIEPHSTAEAYARRRLGAQFDRAAVDGDQALKDALEMVETLKQDSRWQPRPDK